MHIQKRDEAKTYDGPGEYFTGKVRVTPLFAQVAPARVSGASVTFQPGARTAWHTHPAGQALIVTDGHGYVATANERREIRPGDVVVCPPDEKHWHGAAPDSTLTHIAIQESVNGTPVHWLEKVTDDEYAGKRAARQGATR